MTNRHLTWADVGIAPINAPYRSPFPDPVRVADADLQVFKTEYADGSFIYTEARNRRWVERLLMHHGRAVTRIIRVNKARFSHSDKVLNHRYA